MATRHFVNDGATLVQDALEGLALTDSRLIYDPENKAIINSQHDGNSHITLIAGGGAGHEPSFAGLVGNGLLSAAVSGNLFASPSVQQIVNTIVRVGGAAGTLLVIMNYTGDVLHFHHAAEKARLAGFETAVLVVGDDVSVGRKRSGRVGRRGLAGTILVQKILGAIAQEKKKQGVALSELHRVGQEVVDSLATVGAALDHVHIPGRPKEDFHATADQVELGMGIHNETGCRVISPQPHIANLVDQMLDQLLDPADEDRAYVDFRSGELVLLVNNLGGVSNLEFSAITKAVVDRLRLRGLQPTRIFAGTFMTSLDSKGFSITLLKASDKLLEYLDVPTFAPGWSVSSTGRVPQLRTATAVATKSHTDARARAGPSSLKCTSRQMPSSAEFAPNDKVVDIPHFSSAIKRACLSILTAEAEIDRFDAVVGDGDCGSTLGRAARAILAKLDSEGSKYFGGEDGDAVQALDRLAQTVEEHMDGTSGALYAIFLNALASAVRDLATASGAESEGSIVTQTQWIQASAHALAVLQRATPARVGDRTLMDALEPAIGALRDEEGETADAMLSAARGGRDRTRGMGASFGRAVYVPEASWSQVPDPGAAGVVALLEGLLQSSSEAD
ncbi:Dak1 domain-containing protein [Aspergillus pseudoustus]|uniref:Dak1 domain-containing protein n=1 Tax=Aspergillus pseudoustus TaxID=1810923 RepID=A0ABR4IP89_9EURO